MSEQFARRVQRIHDGWVFAPRELAASSTWEDILAAATAVDLPHTWNAVDGQDGGNDYRRGRGTYARRLEADATRGRTWLEFRGVNSSAEVHLNGRLIAVHHGGYSTFRVDITPHLAAENILLVVADNAPNQEVYPQRADFTFYGGIYRDVLMIEVPDVHLDLADHGGPGLVVTPTLVGDRAHVHLEVSSNGGDAVRFSIEGVGTRTVEVADGATHADITIEGVRRWHGRRDPHLYRARAELLVGGDVVDAVDLAFGCREIAVDPDRGFILNGESYPLRGVSRHQDWEGVGNAITPAMMQTDLDLLLEIGATTVRLAHYQHDQYFYDLCDEAGIVVWAEIPQITEFLPDGIANARSQFVELVVQNRHHPSIACWGLSNEITVTGVDERVRDAHRDLQELAHTLDPTRPTTMAHLFLLGADDPLVTVPDVMSYNLYYGWYTGELQDNDDWLDTFRLTCPGVAIGVAEYGADANPAYQSAEPVRGDYSEQFQARYHEHFLDLIEARPWLWATHVWNLADFAADGREEGGIPGRNQKGLVTFDRSVRKDAFHLYRAAWSDVGFVHVTGRRYVNRAEDVSEVTVYSNQAEVSLFVDGGLLATQQGRRVFRFTVPLTGDHEIEARSGALSDRIRVRRVAQPDPSYRMTTAPVTNWFDVDLPSPEGFFSIRDTLGDIKQDERGAELIGQLVSGLAASRGDVAKKVEIPSAMLALLDRQTVESLIRQSGIAVPPEHLEQLNARLNKIAK